MNPFFVIDFSISDSLKTVRKSVLIYETIIKRTGAPVSRERKAIRDIRSSVEYNGAKIIYHPYDR